MTTPYILALVFIAAVAFYCSWRQVRAGALYDRQVELEFVSAIEREFSLYSSRMLDR